MGGATRLCSTGRARDAITLAVDAAAPKPHRSVERLLRKIAAIGADSGADLHLHLRNHHQHRFASVAAAAGPAPAAPAAQPIVAAVNPSPNAGQANQAQMVLQAKDASLASGTLMPGQQPLNGRLVDPIELSTPVIANVLPAGG